MGSTGPDQVPVLRGDDDASQGSETSTRSTTLIQSNGSRIASRVSCGEEGTRVETEVSEHGGTS